MSSGIEWRVRVSIPLERLVITFGTSNRRVAVAEYDRLEKSLPPEASVMLERRDRNLTPWEVRRTGKGTAHGVLLLDVESGPDVPLEVPERLTTRRRA